LKPHLLKREPLMPDQVKAILVAGGSGSRFSSGIDGEPTPKQFRPINGYRLYIWSLSRLYSNTDIAHTVVTCPEAYIDEITRELKEIFPLPKISVVTGGATRQESVYLALRKMLELGAPRYVLIHDAARPFVSAEIVDAAINTVRSGAACTVATPVVDTLKVVDEKKIVSTVDRSRLYAVQTPQAAPFDLLLSCHEKARENGLGVTDDAGILEAFGHEVRIFLGSPGNLKVTVQEDFKTCELLSPLYLPERPL
jgi:2-C-methyl-D-erythritol 4-phosphate cytidylyltransferase